MAKAIATNGLTISSTPNPINKAPTIKAGIIPKDGLGVGTKVLHAPALLNINDIDVPPSLDLYIHSQVE